MCLATTTAGVNIKVSCINLWLAVLRTQIADMQMKIKEFAPSDLSRNSYFRFFHFHAEVYILMLGSGLNFVKLFLKCIKQKS